MLKQRYNYGFILKFVFIRIMDWYARLGMGYRSMAGKFIRPRHLPAGSAQTHLRFSDATRNAYPKGKDYNTECENFIVLEAAAKHLDWLHCSSQGHCRAAFIWDVGY
jgi:hypothetical protein